MYAVIAESAKSAALVLCVRVAKLAVTLTVYARIAIDARITDAALAFIVQVAMNILTPLRVILAAIVDTALDAANAAPAARFSRCR